MASGWEKRVWCCAKFGEILLIGEQLRDELNATSNPQLIRDRRYFIQSYPSCFVGSDTVQWLCNAHQIPNRELAVAALVILAENKIIYNVSGAGGFRDDGSLYRFTNDNGTYPWTEDLAVVLRGKEIWERLSNDDSGLLQRQVENGESYPQAFQGQALVSWLVEQGEACNRQKAVRLGKELLQNDVIRHDIVASGCVRDCHNFKDEPLLYQFTIKFSRKLCLLDLVIPPEQEQDSYPESVDGSSQDSSSGMEEGAQNGLPPTHKHLLTSSFNQRVPCRSESGYHSDFPESPNSPDSNFRQLASSTGSDGDVILPNTTSLTIDSPSGILIRKATKDELTSTSSSYIRKHIRICQDPVGYGLVVRGEGPVYVKAVDPMGPAAKAGLKVGHYIMSINDEMVLELDHRQMAHRIIACNGYMDVVVCEHMRDKAHSLS